MLKGCTQGQGARLVFHFIACTHGLVSIDCCLVFTRWILLAFLLPVLISQVSSTSPYIVLRLAPPHQVFHAQPKLGDGTMASQPQPPAPLPKVQARRGQVTDPHSIAERLRRERIAERIRALQELVPNTNKGQLGCWIWRPQRIRPHLLAQARCIISHRPNG